VSNRTKQRGGCHAAALRYLEIGWQPVALCPPDHVGVGAIHRSACTKPGKVPLSPWKGLQEHRQVRWHLDSEFFHHPTANVGVVLGRVSRLVRVDVDGGEEGKALLRDVAGGDVAETVAFTTGAGMGLLYETAEGEEPPPLQVVTRGGARVEILCEGRQSVLPPSLHVNGRRYRWVFGWRDRGQPLIAPAPGWLWRRFAGGGAGGPRVPRVGAGEPVTELRNERCFRLACCLRRHGCDLAEIRGALDIFNRRCVPPLAGGELATIARSACRYEPKKGVG
jgi:hypothetical protein